MIVCICHRRGHTPSREAAFADLCAQLTGFGIPFHVHEDPGTGARRAAVASIGHALRSACVWGHRPEITGERVIHLEDDVILAPDFRERLMDANAAMTEHGLALLSLYSNLDRPDGIHGGTVSGACAVLLSHDAAHRIASVDPEDAASDSCVERVLVRAAGRDRCATLYPSFVQHRTDVPTATGSARPGYSPSFVRRYGSEAAA